MVEGLKPVDDAVIGNPPNVPIFDILPAVKPDIIALGYDQEHAEERIRASLIDRGLGHIKVVRVEGLSDDLDGREKSLQEFWNYPLQEKNELVVVCSQEL